MPGRMTCNWSVTRDVDPLARAFAFCSEITRRYSRSFYLATTFLPAAKRQAIRALYAFCRWSDDIVDEPERYPGYSLDRWSSLAHGGAAIGDNPLLLAWNETRRRYGLSPEVIDDLLAGLRMDLTIKRYQTFEELRLYCYRVASTVGLLSMQIIGHEEGAAPYAIKLGIALQMTNILRDVGEDARRNRIYLPLDELARFNLCERDILSGTLDHRYLEMMQFQIARTRALYNEAWPGISLLHHDGRFPVGVAAATYGGILSAIERNGYDNHTRRAFVSHRQKLVMLPRVWWAMKRSAA